MPFLFIAKPTTLFTVLCLLQYFGEARSQHGDKHRWYNMGKTQFVLQSSIESVGDFLLLHDNPPSAAAPYWLLTDDEREQLLSGEGGDRKRRRSEATGPVTEEAAASLRCAEAVPLLVRAG